MMDLFALIVGILGAGAGIFALLLIIFPRLLRWLRWRSRRILGKAPPKIPPYAASAHSSRQGHNERVAEYLRRHHPQSLELGFQPGDDPLKASIEFPDLQIDCICSVLSRADGRIYLIIPNAGSQPDIEGIGRTALVTRLLDLRPPYTELIGLDDQRLDEIGELDLQIQPSRSWRLIASDMAYLGVLGGRLCAVPINAEKINFLWDLARHLFRSTDLTYKVGVHRDDPDKRKQLIRLFNQLPCRDLNDLYVGLPQVYPINEILILSREHSDPGPSSLQKLSGKAARRRLEESLLLSSDAHGSNFWKRPKEKLRPAIEYLIDQIPSTQLPPVRELVLKFPGSNVPSFLYHEAAQVVNTWEPAAPLPKLGSVLPGIDRYRGLLFNALYTASTTGRKLISTLFRCISPAPL